MSSRYAIYFTPSDDSPLGIYGTTVLRRRARCSEEWVNESLPVHFNDTATWRKLIAKPAHYGFHATIKAPFELAEDQSSDQLHKALEKFAALQTPISLAGLEPRRTQRYDALAFAEQPEALKTLAARCVDEFEQFRAPLTEADTHRRRLAELTSTQEVNLQKFGYPYVHEEFNFHMTLSGAKPTNKKYLQWLMDLYRATVREPATLDRLCIFHQTDRATPFVRLSEFCFPK